MFAVIHLPQFALQAALRHTPELWAKPVALVDPALSTPRVCDVSASAQGAGVMAGFTPTQALARCRDVLIRHRSPAQEIAATNATLQCAYGFSPNIENTAPGIVTLDLRGLSELKTCDEKSLLAWAARLHAALASLNLAACLGIGPTPNVARHAALSVSASLAHSHFAGKNQSLPRDGRDGFHSVPDLSNENGDAVERVPTHAFLVPPQHPSDAPTLLASATADQRFKARSSAPPIRIVLDPPAFVASLPIAALQPSTDVAILLEKWGLRTVGELLALGQDALAERLGLETFALFAAASTTALRPLHLVRPAEEFEESFDFEQAIETAEPLLFVLNRFVGQLSRRLELTGFAAELLTLRLRLESGAVLERRLRVPEPSRRAEVLLRMLQTHLETLRTDSPIASVGLKVDPVQPAQKQFSLFEAALRDPHQFQETLARLSALVGADRVGTPVRENSHRPDAFTLVPPDFENAPASLTARVPEILRMAPLRRLRPAMKALVEISKLQAPSSKEAPDSKTANVEPGGASPPRDIIDLLGPLFRARSSGHGSTEPQPLAVLSDTPAARHDSSAEGSPRPLAIQCKVAAGRLRIALGPWRASGRWWEASGWQREEWDVETTRGQALRLVHADGEWRVEAVVD